MSQQLEDFVNTLNSSPKNIQFDQVISLISEHYEYTPTRFTNGDGANEIVNDAGTNEGSCKIFAFAHKLGLNESQTLACFGAYYREDVLSNPDATDHANIRTFIREGWSGIRFDRPPLSEKT